MKNNSLKKLGHLFLLLLSIFSAAVCAYPRHAKYIIVYVWDGLRPDSVTREDTPILYSLVKKGAQFSDNHSSYPTFTMMNAASFATGDRAGRTGFFGNTLWHPGITGKDAAGNSVDFNQPVFTEDYKILEDLNKDKLFFTSTLFNSAHEKQLQTAAVGKSGPAFMQDYLSEGLILDEKHVHPLDFANELKAAGMPLPKLAPDDYAAGKLILAADNGSPTEAEKVNFLVDGVTPDASNNSGSPYNRANEYMMNIYLKKILKEKLPTLSVVWMRNPDTTEHIYGPGTADYHAALKSNDKMLGQLLATLKSKHLDQLTDIIFVSDHAHSTVSGPIDQFPLRAIKNKQSDKINAEGYSVSGEIRSAELLNQAGFHAYDGVGCVDNPILSGITKDNAPLYPEKIDTTGKVCGTVGKKYISAAYKVPAQLPTDAVIVAAGGGSDYFYVPSHNKKLVEKLVTFLASHTPYSAIFVDNTRYSALDGTISLAAIGIQNPEGRSPDVIVSFAYDAATKVNGLPGIEFSDSENLRGMHGSFSPVDVHNFLAAVGPDFRTHFKDKLPTGNIDVAPTIAYLLNLDLPQHDGRILWEALHNEKDHVVTVEKSKLKALKPLQHLTVYNALNQKIAATQFSTELDEKILKDGENSYFYFDQAEGVRE